MKVQPQEDKYILSYGVDIVEKSLNICESRVKKMLYLEEVLNGLYDIKASHLLQ